MQGFNYKEFDPFNHGTSTIRFQETPPTEASYVRGVLRAGWNIGNPDQVRSLTVDMYHDPRYNRVSSGGAELFLKRNRPTYARQLLVDRVEARARDRGVPTRASLETVDGESSHFYLPDNTNWSLSKFIDGEHFDGSVLELTQVAHAVGNMHWAFNVIPFAEEVQASIGTPLKHDSEKLQDQLNRLKRPEFAGMVNDLPLSPNEIAETSIQVAAEIPTDIELQVIHDDLHPHNFLFGKGPFSLESDGQLLLGIVDFEQVRVSQKVRDVGFAIHRFSRTYGPQTERNMNGDLDIIKRAEFFLRAYTDVNFITNTEYSALVGILKDEALQKIILVLDGFYDLPEQTAGELRKQVTLLQEADIFSQVV